VAFHQAELFRSLALAEHSRHCLRAFALFTAGIQIVNNPEYLYAILLALLAGCAHWWSWQHIAKPRGKKAVQEVVRILVWMGVTFVIQIFFLMAGIIFLRKISGAYLALWGIVFLAVTVREILRLHRGTNQS
jgi:hypothetical protein